MCYTLVRKANKLPLFSENVIYVRGKSFCSIVDSFSLLIKDPSYHGHRDQDDEVEDREDEEEESIARPANFSGHGRESRFVVPLEVIRQHASSDRDLLRKLITWQLAQAVLFGSLPRTVEVEDSAGMLKSGLVDFGVSAI